MNIKNKYLLVFKFLFALCTLCACAKNAEFNGVYVYESSLGNTIGGDAIVVTYELTVNDQVCEIKIEGYQVAEKLICKIQQSDALLNVYFRSYDTSTVENKYGVRVYQENGLLFTLSKTDELITTWVDLVPNDRLEKKGRYFVVEK
jgi:hypothetical protein